MAQDPSGQGAPEAADPATAAPAGAGWAAVVRTSLFTDPSHGRLPAILLVMTVMSGMVDAISILTLGHVFVANMTGNLVFSGFALGGAAGFSLSTSLIALAGFVVGVLGCRAFLAARNTTRTVMLRDVVGIEAVLFLAALVLSTIVGSAPSVPRRDLLALLCAVALGIQNGLARRLAIAELTTTVMTRTVVGLLWADRQHGAAAVRQAASVVCLLSGAVIGAAIVDEFGRSAALGAVLGLAVVVAVLGAVSARSQQI